MSLDVKHFMKHLYLKMHSSVLYSLREMVSSMWAGANLRKILNVCSCWLFSEAQPNVEALKRTVQVSLRAPFSSHKTSQGMLAILGPLFLLWKDRATKPFIYRWKVHLSLHSPSCLFPFSLVYLHLV